MKVISVNSLEPVRCPKGGFVSYRPILEADGMGFTVTKTVIPAGKRQHWYYKNHLEACYCVSGKGELVNASTDESFVIWPDTLYACDQHDPHYFTAITDVVLICVFGPPSGGERGTPGRRLVCEGDGMSDEFRSPVYDVKSVPIEKVRANEYNPNAVAPPEMTLLETSIWEDGFTQPVVTCYDPETDGYVVVDGFHRFLILRTSERIRQREKGMLPIVVINKAMGDRMASTIRHNRARGTHNIELMSSIVAELVEMGKGDRWICKHIGMSADELLRMKQITGLAALFQNQDFSESWEAEVA